MSPNTVALMSLDAAALMLPGLIIGLSLHEFAHAWSASLLGDNFSRRQGRVVGDFERPLEISVSCPRSCDRRMGLRLLPELFAYANPMPYDAARDMEVELAIGLREDGYAVWQA